MYIDNRLPWEYWVEPAIMLMIAIIASIWTTRMAIKYENIKRRMTKRINVKITGRRGMRFHRCVYRFSGLGEYEGITFYDPWLEAWARHKIGETVSLLINEHNLEEFWFEEAGRISYRRSAIFMWIVTFLCSVLYVGKFFF